MTRPYHAIDPWSKANMHRQRTIEKERIKKEFDEMVDRATKKGEELSKPKEPEKPYIPAPPPWKL